MKEKDLNLQTRADLLKALASPRRLRILSLIMKRDRVTNSVVVKALDISQPDASFHLDKLVRTGILDQSKDGVSKVYGINRELLIERGIDLDKLINAPMD